MQLDPILAFYGAPLLAFWVIYLLRRKRWERASSSTLEEARQAGLDEPASLHPAIDPALCLGCGACARACPEENVLGLIGGKAVLIEPAHCIGHGLCRAACPRGAITLVFGSKKRGLDIPHVGPDFQTNVAGLYIAGELGGMGLIHNAIEQGRQAVEAISARRCHGDNGILDLLIVGGGPAGISASLAAMQKRLTSVTLEQDSFGGTVSHFPRGKIVMTRPTTLPLYGRVDLRETTKENLLGLWQRIARKTDLKIRYGERVTAVTPEGRGGFLVSSTRGQYRAHHVLLAIGRRGTPRKLDVPGEEQAKVVYRLDAPEQYRGRRVLVVGGGDSALEAAASLAEEGSVEVAISYRGEAFNRAKGKNRSRIEELARKRRLDVLLGSNVRAIEPGAVVLQQGHCTTRLGNDAVVVCAGGILPTPFLKSMGIEVETKHGTA